MGETDSSLFFCFLRWGTEEGIWKRGEWNGQAVKSAHAQGGRAVADCPLDFRTRAFWKDWNVSAFSDTFLHGLANYIKDELVSYELATTLDGVIVLATKIDVRI